MFRAAGIVIHSLATVAASMTIIGLVEGTLLIALTVTYTNVLPWFVLPASTTCRLIDVEFSYCVSNARKFAMI